MHHEHQHSLPDGGGPPSFWNSRFAIGLIVIGAIAAYYLWTEHEAHVVDALPYLLLLACPLMHVFMHHGHHGHGGHGGHDARGDDRKEQGTNHQGGAS